MFARRKCNIGFICEQVRLIVNYVWGYAEGMKNGCCERQAVWLGFAARDM